MSSQQNEQLWHGRVSSDHSTHLEPEEEGEVLTDRQAIKENVMLRTSAKTLADLVHICENTVSIDGGCATGGGIES